MLVAGSAHLEVATSVWAVIGTTSLLSRELEQIAPGDEVTFAAFGPMECAIVARTLSEERRIGTGMLAIGKNGEITLRVLSLDRSAVPSPTPL